MARRSFADALPMRRLVTAHVSRALRIMENGQKP